MKQVKFLMLAFLAMGAALFAALQPALAQLLDGVVLDIKWAAGR